MQDAEQLWMCEWCTCMNRYASQECEVCGEKSSVRAPTLRSDIVRFAFQSPAEPTTEPNCENKTTRDTTLFAIGPTPAGQSPPSSDSPPMAMVVTKKEDIPDTKVHDKPVLKRGSTCGDHICFNDASSIYCLICQEPMFFVFANDIKYPDDFPQKLFEKVALLEKTLTEDSLAKIISGLNGGNIDDEIALTSIDITVWGSDDVTYLGPNRDTLSKIFTASVDRQRPMLIQCTIQYLDIDDIQDMMIAIYPNGNTYLLEPTLGSCLVPQVETTLKNTFNGIENRINKCKMCYILHSYWNKTCVRQSPTYINFTESPMWKPIMMLVFISMISRGMSIRDVVAFLVNQDKETMSLLLDSAAERAIAAILPESP
jgi:hypothetical protein